MTKRLNDVTPKEWDEAHRKWAEERGLKHITGTDGDEYRAAKAEQKALKEYMDWTLMGGKAALASRGGENPLSVKERQQPRPKKPKDYNKEYQNVNSPTHYNQGQIECIDSIEAMLSTEEFIGYFRGNSTKYRWRFRYKNGFEDLKKAEWYEKRLVKFMEVHDVLGQESRQKK